MQNTLLFFCQKNDIFMRIHNPFWRFVLKTIKRSVILLLAASICLTGCGKEIDNTELITYNANCETFFNNVKYINDKMNAIDVNSESAVSDLLYQLDTLDKQFTDFAAIEEPEEYAYISEVIDEAASYMKEAVSYFHMAYSDSEYNSSYGEYAEKNYERACKRMNIILSVFHGEYDTNETITVK